MLIKDRAVKIIKVDVNGQTTASPSTVFSVACNSSRYPIWSRIGSFEHVRAGEDGLYGVGSRRIFRTWPLRLLEEVVETVPDRRVGYVVHMGIPFRNYRADIELTPIIGGGTHIRWHNSFYPKIPGTAFLSRRFMENVLGQMLPALAAESERLERDAPIENLKHPQLRLTKK